jgi:hypothetical protein
MKKWTFVFIAAAFFASAASAEKICHRLPPSEMAYIITTTDETIVVGTDCESNNKAISPAEVCQEVYGYAKLTGIWLSECTCEILSPVYVKLIFYPASNPTQDTGTCFFTPDITVSRQGCRTAVKKYFGME